MTGSAKEDRLARLKLLQEELKKIKTNFDGGVLRLQAGTTIVRILPPVGNMNSLFYHQAVGYHMIGNTVVRCSEFTTGYDIKCPICEVNEVLRRGGPNDKKLAGQIRLNKKYWMNVIVRSDGDSFNTADGPMILKAGLTIFDRTRSLVADPDYGLIDDVEEGLDLKIEKSGEGIDTKYNVNPRKGSYQPLMSGKDGKIDWEAVEGILAQAKDLSPVAMPDNPDDDAEFLEELGDDPIVKVYPYERTVAGYGVSLDTIKELSDIIEANKGNGDGEGEADGSYAKPQRQGSSGRGTAGDNGKGSADAIKSRIAALRNK